MTAATDPGQASAAREHILAATLVCVGRYGLAKTTVDDVARVANVSRATIYRRFPGGREELVHALVVSEIGRFVSELAAAAGEARSIEEALEVTIVVAHRAFIGHAVLQKVLQTEPERILPQLQSETPRVVSYLAALIRPHLEGAALRPGLDRGRAAEHLGRMMLSVTLSPGRWDLDDPGQIRRLVRGELLGSVRDERAVAPAGGPGGC